MFPHKREDNYEVDCITTKHVLSRYQIIKLSSNGEDICMANQNRSKYLESTFPVCYPFYGDDMSLIFQQPGFWSHLQVGYCSKGCEAEILPAGMKSLLQGKVGEGGQTMQGGKKSQNH